MLIGHYAASLAARRDADAAPLWLFVAAAQLLDILWALFVMLGVERVEPDAAVAEGVAFVLQPWSHSLAAAIAWALAAFAAARGPLRLGRRDAALVGLVVLSHWLLDLVVHRPDLPLWPGGGPMLGLGLWDHLALVAALEIGLFVLAGLWLGLRVRAPAVPRGRLLAFVLFGGLFMLAVNGTPPPTRIDPILVGGVALFGHLLFVLLAWIVERPMRVRPRLGGEAA